MDDFPWPTSAPTGLDDAWTFLDAHPLPADRFELREGGATDEALAAAETALGRPLPAILRRALQRHDGILERWSHSGPFLAGAAEIVAESARFEREWRELEALLAAGEIDLGRASCGPIGPGPVLSHPASRSSTK